MDECARDLLRTRLATAVTGDDVLAALAVESELLALCSKRQGRRCGLSPAYDLTPSPLVALERRDLAMICGRFGRYANRTNLLSSHGRFLLDQAVAEAVFERIVSTVRDRWRSAMKRAGASERDCAAVASAFLYEGLFYTNIPRGT